jgi:hypothetical protein
MGHVFFHDQEDTLMSQIRIEIDDKKTEIIAKKCPYFEHEKYIFSLLGPKHPFILQPLSPQPDMSDYEGEWDNVVMYELADPISKSIGRMDAFNNDTFDKEKLEQRLHRVRQFMRQSLGALSVCHSRFIAHNNISLRSAFLAGSDKNVKMCGLEKAIVFGSDTNKFRSMAQNDLLHYASVIAELAYGRSMESNEDLERLCSGIFTHNKQLTELRRLITDLLHGRFITAGDVLNHSFFKVAQRKVAKDVHLHERTAILLSTVKRTNLHNSTDKENMAPMI